MKPIIEDLQKVKKKFTRKPRYTLVFHDVRKRLGISWHEYGVIDSIHKLSHHSENHLYCSASKEKIADFLGLSRRTIFNAIEVGIKMGLVEKNERGDLRTTQKWIDTVELFKDSE